MREPREPIIDKAPTEYFKIDESHSELIGDLTVEVLNDANGPTMHINKESSRRLSLPNNGDVVILGLSQQGVDKINAAISSLLGPEATMAQVKMIITQLDFITWEKPGSGN